MLATRLTRLDLEARATELRTCICGVQGSAPWTPHPAALNSVAPMFLLAPATN